MDLIELTKHPERMDRDTLYELRSQVALYPYHQTLRLLMLQNLYLLHDPGFDEELRRAAIYITDRRVLFNMVEAAHYQHPSHQNTPNTPSTQNTPTPSSRTTELINSFLDTIPQEEAAPRKRRPTPADAAIDYVAYLLDTEGDTPQEETESVPEMRGQDLIDTFINVASRAPMKAAEAITINGIQEIFFDSVMISYTFSPVFIPKAYFTTENSLSILSAATIIYSHSGSSEFRN